MTEPLTPTTDALAHRPRVLLADDDEMIRRTCRRVLHREGFDVDEARDGIEGIALLSEHLYAMVVTDNRMPGATGIELLAETAARQPEARRVLMSGTLDPDTIRLAQEIAHAYFEKTGATAQMHALLREQTRALPAALGAP